MRIALAGNPNSGKTTMYNVLTGSNEKVGNWAGVTVDKKEHPVKKKLCPTNEEIIAVDLPGAYSMSPYTSEESITSDYVKNEKPDVIINIVDSTNLSRSLFFTTQLLELGIPVVVALNKADVSEKKKNKIDKKALAELLGCRVVNTVSTSGSGIEKLVGTALEARGGAQKAPYFNTGADLSTKDGAEMADKARFAFVDKIVSQVERRQTLTSKKNIQDKADAILTNKWLGIPIFALVMFLVFWISQSGPAVWLADLITGWLELGKEALAGLINSDSIWSAVLLEGIIGGFIAIVGFLPLVMIMYFLIALLEGCGYMARATIVLEPIFKKVGLNGKSVIPFVIGTGCAVPGVMAARTIRDERQRRATVMLTPFMPCGAKLPVIAMFAGAFFGDSAWVGAAMYFVGIIVIILSAFIVNAVTGNKKKSYFIMEMPEYKLPSLSMAFKSMCQRGWSFIVKAGTIILVCNFVVHVMQNFDWTFHVTENPDISILATVAAPFSLLFAPIFGDKLWKLAAATITGFIAKENVVGTLGVSFGIVDTNNYAEVFDALGMSSVAALAFLVFNLFTPPCFAAIGAMNAELKSKKWLAFAICFQFGVGYTLAFLVNFFGTLFTGGSFAHAWTVILGWCLVVAFVLSIVFLILRRKRKQEKV